ncbi:MAG: PucR family transcriptional regulator [Eggerthellaceae bacterium]|nr:PucR family transcriptional regulator [Eggerthellaceae bacterium]
MHFPLDILNSYLADQSVDIIKGPAHPKDQFDWVTSVSDFLRDSENQTIIPVFDGIESASSITPKIVIIRSLKDAGAAEALAPDDFLIRTSLPASLLADRIQRFLFGIIQWNDRMTEMVDSGCISMELLKESEPMLGEYIGLSDSAFSYIAHTPDIPPIDEISQYFVKNKNYPLHAIQATRDAGLMRRWENQDWTMVSNKGSDVFPLPTVSRVIKRRGAYAAHLLLVSNGHITGYTRFLFDLLAQKVEACLRRHWRLENPLEQRYVYFLQEVFKGNVYGDERLAERAEIHGIPVSGAFEVCVIGSVWKVGSASYLAKRILEMEPSAKVVVEDAEAIILLYAHQGQEERLSEMEANIFEAARRMSVEVGVSEQFSELGLAYFALEEARCALKYGSLYSSRYVNFDADEALTTTVFRFRRYFTYCALDQFEGDRKLVSNVLTHMNPLLKIRESDERKGSNDFEILRTYLYQEGRPNQISQKLHMHRNTVLYRIDKIREVIGYDLTDSDVRQFLRTLYFLTK